MTKLELTGCVTIPLFDLFSIWVENTKFFPSTISRLVLLNIVEELKVVHSH